MSVRLASTVCLVRDRDGIEVLMVQRPHTSRFMPSVWVFPGGAVDDADNHPPDALDGLDAWRVAAVREMIEETGLWIETDGVVERGLSSSAFADIESNGSSFSIDSLVYFANWVTPEVFPLRFDTRFFIGLADDGVTGAVDGDELVDLEWVRPQDALAREHDRTWDVAFPTRKTLELLATGPTAVALVDRLRAIDFVPSVQPRLLVSDGSARIVLPDEPEFDLIAEEQTDPDLLVRLGKVIAEGGDDLPAEFKRRR